MTDDIGFSGSGAPDLKASPRFRGNAGDQGGASVELPEFFKESDIPEDEVSLETTETPREEAARLDAVQDIGSSSSGAAKL